jgi:CRP-like cAMP-binding protein
MMMMTGAVCAFFSSIVLPVSMNQWPSTENCFSKGDDDDSFYYFRFGIVRMVRSSGDRSSSKQGARHELNR